MRKRLPDDPYVIEPAGTPTMNAFVLKRKSPTLSVYERNPFYPKIDPAGNQLPYVDQTSRGKSRRLRSSN